MAEPIFLEGYSGQTVDQLLALETTHRIDSLVLAFEEAIGRKDASNESGTLTLEETTVLAVEALEREVNNGGFHQFFINTMEFAPVIVDALQRIGCPKNAAITEQAVKALCLPELSVPEIEKIIYEDDDQRDKMLDECDARFFEYTENIAAQLFSYIKANKHCFSL